MPSLVDDDAEAGAGRTIAGFPVERWIFAGEILGVLVVAAWMLWVRLLPYGNMVKPGAVYFVGTDPYYHLRNTLVVLAHFPNVLPYDPWTQFPLGTRIGQFGTPFDQLLAGILLVVGGGSAPDLRTVEVAAVIYPAVLGALTVVPVYLYGRQAFGRLGAAYAVVALAFIPGEFLVRSLAGYFDHHVAEALLSTFAAAGLLWAVREATRRQDELAPLWREGPGGFAAGWREVGTRRVLAVTYPGILAGLALATYLLVWNFGILFVAIFDAFLALQFILQARLDRPTGGLVAGALTTFLVAAILVLPWTGGNGLRFFQPSDLEPLLLLLSMLGVLVLQGLRSLVARYELPPYAYALTVLGGLVVGYLLVRFLVPPLYQVLNRGLFWVAGTGNQARVRTIAEVQSTGWAGMASEQGYLWASALAGLVATAWRAWRTGRPGATLLVVWSVVILVAAFNQLRFNYYWSICIVLLNGLLLAEMARLTKLDRRLARWASGERGSSGGDGGSSTRRRGRRARGRQSGSSSGITLQVAAVVAVLLFLVPGLVIPTQGGSVQPVWKIAKSSGAGDVQLWTTELRWLRDNTPPVPGFSLTDLYKGPIDYAAGAYGVLSWWDYGHWIEVIGHRPPVANPFQEQAPFASIYFTDKPAAADTALANYSGNHTVRYVMIDDAMDTGKFGAITVWAHRPGLLSYGPKSNWSTGQGQSAPLPTITPRFDATMLANLYERDANGLPDYRLVHESPRYEYLGYVLVLQGNRYQIACFHQTFPSGQCPFAPRMNTQQVLNRTSQHLLVPVGYLRSSQVTGYAWAVQVVSPLKTFEHVQGAVLHGRGPPGGTVTVNVTLASGGARTFGYVRSTTIGADGNYTLRVSYATGPATGDAGRTVNATGPYTVVVRSSGGQVVGSPVHVAVPDPAVLQGQTVEVPPASTG